MATSVDPPNGTGLEPTIRRLKSKEKTEIKELLKAEDKAKHQRCMLAELSRTIDDVNADVQEKEAQARGFAEHCAEEREYALLEVHWQRVRTRSGSPTAA